MNGFSLVRIATQSVFVVYRRFGTACRSHLILFCPLIEANNLGRLFCMANVKNCEFVDWDPFAKLDFA